MDDALQGADAPEGADAPQDAEHESSPPIFCRQVTGGRRWRPPEVRLIRSLPATYILPPLKSRGRQKYVQKGMNHRRLYSPIFYRRWRPLEVRPQGP
jgi:hypothetical protein